MGTQRGFLSALVACAVLVPASYSQVPDSTLKASGAQFQPLRAHSDLVALHVVVLDRASQPVRGLAQERFRIYEDGVPQTIQFFSHEDQAPTIGLVIDNSGSMHKKRGDVLIAGLALIRASNPLDEIFIVNFNEQAWMGLPEGTAFTRDLTTLTKALSHVEARGQTALYDAISRGLEHLSGAANHRRVLVVMSDGGDNSSATRLEELLQRAQQTETVIYTIGLFDEDNTERNLRVLKRLAAVTGGEAFLSGNAQDAVKVLERIARDIRNVYTIGYVPSNDRRDGEYRAISVSLDAPERGKLKVRVRAGYFAPSDEAPGDRPARPSSPSR